MCKHHYSCSEHVLISFWSILKNSFMFKLALNNMFFLLAPKKFFSQFKNLSGFKDCAQFGIFSALMNIVYKLVLCLLRRHCKNDRINAPIAGFFSGLATVIEQKRRRQFLTILLMARACDTSMRAGQSRGVVNSLYWFYFLLWWIGNVFQEFLFGVERDIMNP